MAFDLTGNLYTSAFLNSDPTTDFLYRLNIATGAATQIGPIAQGVTIDSGVFASNTLYGFSTNASDSGIYTINTTTGAGTLVASYALSPGSSIFAAATQVVPTTPTPEPAYCALMGVLVASWIILVSRPRNN